MERDLTQRQDEVLKLLAWGYRNLQIATRLGISLKTLDNHRANGLAKLGIGPERSRLVRYAVEHGWYSQAAPRL